MISIAMIIIWWWWHAFAGPGGVDDSKLKLQDLKILFFWLRQNYLMTDFGHVLKHLVKFMSTIWENCWEYRLPAWEMYGTGRIGKILFLCNLIFIFLRVERNADQTYAAVRRGAVLADPQEAWLPPKLPPRVLHLGNVSGTFWRIHWLNERNSFSILKFNLTLCFVASPYSPYNCAQTTLENPYQNI